MKKNILCVKWGTKYDDYVEKLKTQVEKHCSYDFNFYCLTDNPQRSYDIKLPTHWDKYFNQKTNRFWAYRKCYMFNENLFPEIKGDDFLYFDLDILIHNSIDPLFELSKSKPMIIRGWWNDIDVCKKNFGKGESSLINSSVIRWQRKQLKNIYNQISTRSEIIFFTYRTLDNYLNHCWYDIHNNEKCFFNTFEKGMIYSWYKGNVFPDDMETKILRNDHMICLFNNSAEQFEHMHEIKELNEF
jgi:hypothetical protein